MLLNREGRKKLVGTWVCRDDENHSGNLLRFQENGKVEFKAWSKGFMESMKGEWLRFPGTPKHLGSPMFLSTPMIEGTGPKIGTSMFTPIPDHWAQSGQKHSAFTPNLEGGFAAPKPKGPKETPLPSNDDTPMVNSGGAAETPRNDANPGTNKEDIEEEAEETPKEKKVEKEKTPEDTKETPEEAEAEEAEANTKETEEVEEAQVPETPGIETPAKADEEPEEEEPKKAEPENEEEEEEDVAAPAKEKSKAPEPKKTEAEEEEEEEAEESPKKAAPEKMDEDKPDEEEEEAEAAPKDKPAGAEPKKVKETAEEPEKMDEDEEEAEEPKEQAEESNDAEAEEDEEEEITIKPKKKSKPAQKKKPKKRAREEDEEEEAEPIDAGDEGMEIDERVKKEKERPKKKAKKEEKKIEVPKFTKKKPKDKNAPKKGRSSYVFFVADQRKAHPEWKDLPFAQVAKQASDAWAAASAEEKADYDAKSKADKERYSKEMEEYKKTDAYREHQVKLGEYRETQATHENKVMRKKPKDKNRPRKGMSAYFHFLKEQRKLHPEWKEIPITEAMKRGGQLWEKASEEEKAKYQDLATADKQRYEEELAAYKTTDLYRKFKAQLEEYKKQTKGVGNGSFKKDENKPKKPPTAFFLFMAANRKKYTVKGQKASETVKKISAQWKIATPEEKKEFEDEAQRLKEEYNKKLSAYVGSPLHQEYEEEKEEFYRKTNSKRYKGKKIRIKFSGIKKSEMKSMFPEKEVPETPCDDLAGFWRQLHAEWSVVPESIEEEDGKMTIRVKINTGFHTLRKGKGFSEELILTKVACA